MLMPASRHLLPMLLMMGTADGWASADVRVGCAGSCAGRVLAARLSPGRHKGLLECVSGGLAGCSLRWDQEAHTVVALRCCVL